jgi:NAD(P)-dependent dehydrogenase (short-subunit alcohol dehydrogenase family)
VLVITTALVVLYVFVTTRTVIGRQIYAVGGNAKAAKLSGIKTERLAFLTFVNMPCWRRLPASSLPRGSTRRRRRPASVSNSTSLPPASSGEPPPMAAWRASAARGVGALIMGVMNNGMSILGIGIRLPPGHAGILGRADRRQPETSVLGRPGGRAGHDPGGGRFDRRVIGQGNMPCYTTAKSAVQGLTRALARDLGPNNVRVNSILPGWT